MHTYPVADVYISKGLLVVDASSTSMQHRHYNVEVFQQGDSIVVLGEKPSYDVQGFCGSVVDPELAVDRDVKLVKKWPWSKNKIKKCKNGWVELKERDSKKYRSNRYTIIE
jgi:4-hydroxy-3-methylbut-2-enyl diphosphate reductase IspH